MFGDVYKYKNNGIWLETTENNIIEDVIDVSSEYYLPPLTVLKPSENYYFAFDINQPNEFIKIDENCQCNKLLTSSDGGILYANLKRINNYLQDEWKKATVNNKLKEFICTYRHLMNILFNFIEDN